MRYRIMSFNVQNLSLNSETEKLDLIAKIILDNDIDIVAMQEVLSEGKILTGIDLKSVSGAARAYEHSLKRRMGENWAMCWRDPKTRAKDYVYLGNDRRGEGYAYLWNTNRVNLLEEDGNKEFPKIHRHYSTKIDNDLIRLIREPCVGRFKINNRPVEIRLITVHIVYGKPKAENFDLDLDTDIGGAISMRKNEFRILAGQIYPEIAEYYKQTTCTAPYTVILGDYNLNLAASGVGKAILSDVLCFDQKGRAMSSFNPSAPTIVSTVQPKLTTINQQGDGLSSNYDHFSFDQRVASVVPEIDGYVINPADYIQTEENIYGAYKNKVSDHLPIVLTLDL